MFFFLAALFKDLLIYLFKRATGTKAEKHRERERRGREKERERDSSSISWFIAHKSGCNGWGQARLKPGMWNSTQVSHMGGRDPGVPPNFHCF